MENKYESSLVNSLSRGVKTLGAAGLAGILLASSPQTVRGFDPEESCTPGESFEVSEWYIDRRGIGKEALTYNIKPCQSEPIKYKYLHDDIWTLNLFVDIYNLKKDYYQGDKTKPIHYSNAEVYFREKGDRYYDALSVNHTPKSDDLGNNGLKIKTYAPGYSYARVLRGDGVVVITAFFNEDIKIGEDDFDPVKGTISWEKSDMQGQGFHTLPIHGLIAPKQ